MYHIPNDKRAVSSADNLEKALYELLTTRDMNEISVTDLCHTSGVSRATFYRLYDNPTDILRHGLDNTMETIRQEQSELMATGKPIDLKRNMQLLLAHYEPIEAAVKCHRTDLIHSAIETHLSETRAFIIQMCAHVDATERQIHYISHLFVGMMTSMLTAWIKGGRKETAAQLISQMRMFSELYYKVTHL